MRPNTRTHLTGTAGYSLVELIVSMGLLTVIMGVCIMSTEERLEGVS